MLCVRCLGGIKEAGRTGMAAADVEALCRWMWAHCYPTLPDVAQGLRDALEEGAIARLAGASAEQVDVMRGIRAAAEAEAEHMSEQRIAVLDAAVAAAGEGPFYFCMVVLMYGTWAEEYRAYQSSAGSLPSTPGSGSEGSGEWPETQGGVRRTRFAHVGGSGARIAALLARLESVGDGV